MRTRPGSSPRGKDTGARSHADASRDTSISRVGEGTNERLDAGLCGRCSPIKRGRALELDRTAHYYTLHSPTPRRLASSVPLLFACQLPELGPRRESSSSSSLPLLQWRPLWSSCSCSPCSPAQVSGPNPPSLRNNSSFACLD